MHCPVYRNTLQDAQAQYKTKSTPPAIPPEVLYKDSSIFSCRHLYREKHFFCIGTVLMHRKHLSLRKKYGFRMTDRWNCLLTGLYKSPLLLIRKWFRYTCGFSFFWQAVFLISTARQKAWKLKHRLNEGYEDWAYIKRKYNAIEKRHLPQEIPPKSPIIGTVTQLSSWFLNHGLATQLCNGPTKSSF